MLLIEKCACPCLFKMGKPSLWLLPVDNTTSHVDLTLFFWVFFKVALLSFPPCGSVTSVRSSYVTAILPTAES